MKFYLAGINELVKNKNLASNKIGGPVGNGLPVTG